MAMTTHRRTTRIPTETIPDWSLLPTELIQYISEKIIFIEQYAHFRLVCQQWRHVCPPHPCHLIGQIPWLLLPHGQSSSTLSFYDFSNSKTYNIDLPVIVGNSSYCNSRGWILLQKDSELSLINPITRELKINCLPSVNAPPIVAIAEDEKPKDRFYHRHITKFILTTSLSDEDCIVIAMFTMDWELGFCKMGDSCWTILKFRDNSQRCISDIKYKDGLVYAVNNKGKFSVYDLRNLSRKILIGGLSYVRRFDSRNLVIGEGEFDGVPLLVRCVFRGKGEYQVYKCANGKGKSRWRRVRNIGNSVLLQGYHKQCEIMSLSNVQLNGWKANRVYFHSSKIGEDGSRYGSTKMASIENESFEELPTLFSLLHRGEELPAVFSWFTPSLS